MHMRARKSTHVYASKSSQRMYTHDNISRGYPIYIYAYSYMYIFARTVIYSTCARTHVCNIRTQVLHTTYIHRLYAYIHTHKLVIYLKYICIYIFLACMHVVSGVYMQSACAGMRRVHASAHRLHTRTRLSEQRREWLLTSRRISTYNCVFRALRACHVLKTA